MSQLTYSTQPAVGVVGALASAGNRTIIGKRIADGVVRPGQYVVYGSGGTCLHPSAAPTGLNRGGVALRLAYMDDDGVYADGDVVEVCEVGEVWVSPEAAVTELGAAFVRHTAAGEEELGAFRQNADTSDATAVPGLRYLTAGTGVIKLEVTKSSYVEYVDPG